MTWKTLESRTAQYARDPQNERIKSFCAAKPAQKVGWTDAGARADGGQETEENSV
jgi:hypothetical protein